MTDLISQSIHIVAFPGKFEESPNYPAPLYIFDPYLDKTECGVIAAIIFFFFLVGG